MKKTILLASINLILALLQISFFPELFGLAIGPNLVLAYAISLNLLGKSDEIVSGVNKYQNKLFFCSVLDNEL